MEARIACDLCQNRASIRFLSSRQWPTFQLARCSVCGLIYLDPRPSRHEIGNFYTDQYYTSQPPMGEKAHTLHNQLKRLAYTSKCQHPSTMNVWQRRMTPLMTRLIGWRAVRNVPVLPIGRLLDVGCGNGEYIAWVRDYIPGWQTEGVEVNEHAAQQARDHFHLDIHTGHLQELALPSESYDMISFWHSLEHTFSPVNTLKEAHRLLKPSGWIGIEVPNIESPEARWFGADWYHLAIPFHLYHFSPGTLRQMILATGFEILSMKPLYSNAAFTATMSDQGPLRSLTKRLISSLARFSPYGLRVYAVKR